MVSFLNCVDGTTPELPPGAHIVDLDGVLAGGSASDDWLVIYAPPPGWPREQELATALAGRERVVIVRDERWDGFAADPLAAAATGVISGFGEAGIAAAIANLSQG